MLVSRTQYNDMHRQSLEMMKFCMYTSKQNRRRIFFEWDEPSNEYGSEVQEQNSPKGLKIPAQAVTAPFEVVLPVYLCQSPLNTHRLTWLYY